MFFERLAEGEGICLAWLIWFGGEQNLSLICGHLSTTEKYSTNGTGFDWLFELISTHQMCSKLWWRFVPSNDFTYAHFWRFFCEEFLTNKSTFFRPLQDLFGKFINNCTQNELLGFEKLKSTEMENQKSYWFEIKSITDNYKILWLIEQINISIWSS